MALLSYTELQQLVVDGVIEGVSLDSINSSSIDVHLSNVFYKENEVKGKVISLKKKELLSLQKVTLLPSTPFLLYPQQFILGATKEIFHLPNDISGRFSLNSNIARRGLFHSDADWLEAGWNGSNLVLELQNVTSQHILALEEDLAIGKIVFWRHNPVPDEASYAIRGSFNGKVLL